MTVTLKENNQLVVPPSVQRQAGIKRGDRVEFRVSARTITITPVEPTYKPTKAEWAAIEKGRSEFERGEYVTLNQLHNELESARHQKRKKTTRKSA
jgi:bifunctional DNA-binding transcriptional regulator/antitoxin component of YhaV-PrlF toxin-antitoxin module